MYCPNCGKKLDDDANFCKYCGKALSSSAQSASPVNAASAGPVNAAGVHPAAAPAQPVASSAQTGLFSRLFGGPEASKKRRMLAIIACALLLICLLLSVLPLGQLVEYGPPTGREFTRKVVSVQPANLWKALSNGEESNNLVFIAIAYVLAVAACVMLAVDKPLLSVASTALAILLNLLASPGRAKAPSDFSSQFMVWPTIALLAALILSIIVARMKRNEAIWAKYADKTRKG